MLLTSEQEDAYHLIKNGHNLVVLGQAGTGKSVLVREAAKRLTNLGRSVIVTATTGIAASQFHNATTLHRWSGILDGRFSNDEAARKCIADKSTRTRLCATDVLIIDEISMLSAKLFEQVEYVCRFVREEHAHFFGGIQIICVGDFYQLPPVANDLYLDPGRYAFLSSVWKHSIPHNVFLKNVMRQTDVHLISAINELERGHPSSTTNELMLSLARPLSTGELYTPIVLYATNFEVDCHNASCLQELRGQPTVYTSEDSGDSIRLNKIMAKKHLSLKVGSPVILLKNLSSSLVNGSRGTVISVEDDAPVVMFHDAKIPVRLERASFTAYDPRIGKVVAERVQIPLNLAFSLTIHKSQGQTFPRVVVDCRRIIQPGQAGVAVGRAVSTEQLQVLHYHPTCSIPHQQEVEHFCSSPGQDVAENLSCCREVIADSDVTPHGTNPDPEEAQQQQTLSEESDFNEDELHMIDALEEEDKTKHAATDQTQLLGGEDTTQPHFNEENAVSFLQSLLSPSCLTSQQMNINLILKSLCDKHSANATTFLNQQHDKIVEMLPKKKENRPTSKEWSSFYNSIHTYLDSPEYLMVSSKFISVVPVDTRADQRHVCGRLMAGLRNMAVKSRSERMTTLQVPVAETTVVQQSAHGKIRYVGGRTVAKLKYKHMTTVKKHIENAKPFCQLSALKVQLLESLTVSQHTILGHTKYQHSVQETFHRQNLSCGLTNISDQAFEFFLQLEQTRIPLYTPQQLTEHCGDILMFVRKTLLDDNDLFKMWTSIVSHEFTTSKFSLTSGKDASVEEILQSTVDATVATVESYQEIVCSYCNVTDNEYRKKVRSEMGRKKEMEHRKKVLLRSKAKPVSTSISMDVINMDTSSKKTISHLRLKSAVLENVENIKHFNKKDLIKLAKLYGKSYSASLKKDILVSNVASLIRANEHMTSSDTTIGTSSDTQYVSAPQPMAGTSSDTQYVSAPQPVAGTSSHTQHVSAPQPVTGTSSDTTSGTMPTTVPTSRRVMKRASSSNQGQYKGKGKQKKKQKTDHEENSEDNDDEWMAPDLKCHKKGKGKGKARGKKKPVKIQDEIDEDFCGGCLDMYRDGDEEPWIGCSKCDRWWHRNCGGLVNIDSWEEFSSEEVEWTCPTCSANF